MTEWVPSVTSPGSPRYRAIVDALDTDIASGRIKPGTRLLPHRDMAERLGLSVGTVSKAYAEAEQRGLISGEVGRGTFVLARRAGSGHAAGAKPAASVNLTLNVPPPTGEDELVAATVAAIAQDHDFGDLLAYRPHQGSRAHREAIAGWLATQNVTLDPDRVFITQGTQHALSVALGLVARQGDIVLTENLTYSGMVALSAHSGCRLFGVALDDEGLVPEALEQALNETGSKVVYSMPTLQTPTGAVMSDERRRAIAAIIRRHDAFLIEDDAYAFLLSPAPKPIAALIPERSFYAVSFAKCLSPGLRVGAMTMPDAFRDRGINALRATGWMAVPLMAEVVARLIQSGDLASQVALKRESAAMRAGLALRILADWLPGPAGPAGFHLWLPLPVGRTITSLVGQAALAGITLAGPAALAPLEAASRGVRLCLGAARSDADLERALETLREILENAEAISIV